MEFVAADVGGLGAHGLDRMKGSADHDPDETAHEKGEERQCEQECVPSVGADRVDLVKRPAHDDGRPGAAVGLDVEAVLLGSELLDSGRERLGIWLTQEERFARRVAACGHDVAVGVDDLDDIVAADVKVRGQCVAFEKGLDVAGAGVERGVDGVELRRSQNRVEGNAGCCEGQGNHQCGYERDSDAKRRTRLHLGRLVRR